MIVKFCNLDIVVKSRIVIEDFVGVGRHAKQPFKVNVL